MVAVLQYTTIIKIGGAQRAQRSLFAQPNLNSKPFLHPSGKQLCFLNKGGSLLKQQGPLPQGHATNVTVLIAASNE